MQGYLKELRYPISGLVLLLLFAALVLSQRRETRLATEKVETWMLADAFLGATPATARFLGCDPVSLPDDDNQGQSPSSAQRAIEHCFDRYGQSRKDFESHGLIEVLGQSLDDCPDSSTTRISLPALGFVHLATRRAQDKSFGNELAELAADQKAWDKVEARRPRPAPPQSAAPTRTLYFLEAIVGHSDRYANATIRPETRLVFTNVTIEEHPRDWTVTHGIPGPLTVHIWDAGARAWQGPYDRETVQALGLQEARASGSTAETLPAAYLDLRTTYEQQEVELPVLEMTVSAASFLFIVLGLAIALACWASYLLRAIRTDPPATEEEPWIMVEPYRRVGTARGWDKPVAYLEIVLFALFHASAILAPPLLGTLLLLNSAGDHLWLQIAALLLAVALSLALAFNYIAMLRTALRPAIPLEDKTALS